MLWARGLRKLTIASTTLSYDAITSMIRQSYHQHDSTATSSHGQVTSVATSHHGQRYLGSAIVNMTWQCHHQHDSTSILCHGQVASVALSPAWLGSSSLAWLGIDITPRPSHLSNAITSMTRQHRHQHDLTSHSGQVTSAAPSPAWLGSTITSMTRQWHCAMANVALATPSSTWLGNATSSMTQHRQRHRQHNSTMSSLAWLGNAIASMTQLRHCQHNSASTSCNDLIVDMNNDICSQWQADTLSAHTSTIHWYTWF
jgi:hypothetical protein